MVSELFFNLFCKVINLRFSLLAASTIGWLNLANQHIVAAFYLRELILSDYALVFLGGALKFSPIALNGFAVHHNALFALYAFW